MKLNLEKFVKKAAKQEICLTLIQERIELRAATKLASEKLNRQDWLIASVSKWIRAEVFKFCFIKSFSGGIVYDQY